MATPLLHRTLRCAPRPSLLLRRPRQPTRSPRSTTGGTRGFGSVFPNPPPPLQRRADRPLPSLRAITRRWPPYLVPFLAVLALSAAAVINYEKGQHSVVASCLYALRVNERVRERLGDEIYFAHRVPWISGSIDPMHGKIDISFWVKGTKGRGMMQFRCTRRKRKEFVSDRGDYIWTVADWTSSRPRCGRCSSMMAR
jgi:cytochrome c oxidase assembly factor 1